MLRRISTAAAGAGLVLMLAATGALAGGWATIEPDAGTIKPVEGEPTEFGFTVLQHGETPIDWAAPIVTLTDMRTGQEVLALTTAKGEVGHYVAQATLPAAGFWSWQVRLQDLEVETPPAAITVRALDGTAPLFDASMVLAAIQQADRSQADTMSGQIATLTGQVEAANVRTRALEQQLAELKASSGTEAAAPAGESVPVVGVVILAILAGATAGFVMTWLGGRPRSVVSVAPTQQGADPA